MGATARVPAAPRDRLPVPGQGRDARGHSPRTSVIADTRTSTTNSSPRWRPTGRPNSGRSFSDVVNGLEAIHERRRRMLLFHAAGFPCDEIAADYRINPSRPRALVYRARLQLRALARHGPDGPGG